MAHTDSHDDLAEFCENFGKPPLSSADLQELSRRPTGISHTEAAVLVKEVEVLRHIASETIRLLDSVGDLETARRSEWLKLVRFLVNARSPSAT